MKEAWELESTGEGGCLIGAIPDTTTRVQYRMVQWVGLKARAQGMTQGTQSRVHLGRVGVFGKRQGADGQGAGGAWPDVLEPPRGGGGKGGGVEDGGGDAGDVRR